MTNRFNFQATKTEKKPRLADAKPLASSDPTKVLQQALKTVENPTLSTNPPAPATTINPTNTSADEISSMTLPTDDYEWEGQEFPDTESALPVMNDLIGKLQNSFGQDGVDKALYRCLHFLDQHAFLKDVLAPRDVGVMMRGLAISSAVVVDKKSKRRAKTAQKEQERTWSNYFVGNWRRRSRRPSACSSTYS